MDNTIKLDKTTTDKSIKEILKIVRFFETCKYIIINIFSKKKRISWIHLLQLRYCITVPKQTQFLNSYMSIYEGSKSLYFYLENWKYKTFYWRFFNI